MRGVATFILLLLVSMPIGIAAEVSNLQITGAEGVDGYYRLHDITNMTVDAALDAAGVQPDQLRIFIDGDFNRRFEECERVGEGLLYKCTFFQGFAPFPGEHEYEIKLYRQGEQYDESATPVATVKKDFTYDNNPPVIERLELIPSASSDGRVRFEYDLIDRAYDVDNRESCAGLREITFALDSAPDVPFHREELDRGCDVSRVSEYVLTGIPDGDHTIIAYAYDALGQRSQAATVVMSLDQSKPLINSSVRIIDERTGLEVPFIRSSDRIVATVIAYVDDPFLDSVRADLSKLGGGSNVAGIIRDDRVEFQGVVLDGMSECKITLTATDTFGHEQIKDLVCLTVLDNTAPRLTSLTTDKSDEEGNPILGVDTVLTATFIEAESGLENNSVLMDLRTAVGAIMPAETCVQLGNEYRCLWQVTPKFSGTIENVRIHESTADRAGNKIQPDELGRMTIAAVLTVPEIGDVVVDVIHGTDEGLPALVKGGQFNLIAPIEGHDLENVYANLSSIGGGFEQMDCRGDTCTLVGDVEVSGPLTTNITIIARNSIGNPAYKQVEMKIFGLMTGEPAYWTPNIQCSPSSVDRQTASLIEQHMFCDVNLGSATPDVYPLAVQFEGFSACEGDDMKYVDDIRLLNAEGSTHPTFAITLKDHDYQQQFLNLECDLNIYTASASAQTVNPNAEVERVTMRVTFFNQALGDIYTNLDGQVQEAVEDALDNMEFVGKLQKFFDMASKFCNFKATISSIAGSLESIAVMMGIVRDATVASPAGPKTNSMAAKLCTSRNSFNKAFYNEGGVPKSNFFGHLEKMCIFVNCRAGGKNDLGRAGVIAGGAPWCQAGSGSLVDKISKLGAVDGIAQPDPTRKLIEADSVYARSANLDIKNSLILSSMCLCVPGIIFNLQKLREIKCQKALCMKREVRDRGMPPSVCSDVEGYLTCNFIVGDIFSLFPPVRVWSQATDILAGVLANPLELLTVFSGLKCRGFCKAPGQATAYKLCVYPKTLAKIGDAINSIKGIQKVKDFSLDPNSGACEQLEELAEDYQ